MQTGPETVQSEQAVELAGAAPEKEPGKEVGLALWLQPPLLEALELVTFSSSGDCPVHDFLLLTPREKLLIL